MTTCSSLSFCDSSSSTASSYPPSSHSLRLRRITSSKNAFQKTINAENIRLAGIVPTICTATIPELLKFYADTSEHPFEGHPWPTSTNFKCWGCKQHFQGPPVPYASNVDDKNNLRLAGIFCGTPCARWLMRATNGLSNTNCHAYSRRLWKLVFGKDHNQSRINIAPPYQAQVDFGGDMAPDEFKRRSLSKHYTTMDSAIFAFCDVPKIKFQSFGKRADDDELSQGTAGLFNNAEDKNCDDEIVVLPSPPVTERSVFEIFADISLTHSDKFVSEPTLPPRSASPPLSMEVVDEKTKDAPSFAVDPDVDFSDNLFDYIETATGVKTKHVSMLSALDRKLQSTLISTQVHPLWLRLDGQRWPHRAPPGTRCWACTLEFDSVPLPCASRFESGGYCGFGVVCSPECGRRYICMYMGIRWMEILGYFNAMLVHVFDLALLGQQIAPIFHDHVDYGGHLDSKTFISKLTRIDAITFFDGALFLFETMPIVTMNCDFSKGVSLAVSEGTEAERVAALTNALIAEEKANPSHALITLAGSNGKAVTQNMEPMFELFADAMDLMDNDEKKAIAYVNKIIAQKAKVGASGKAKVTPVKRKRKIRKKAAGGKPAKKKSADKKAKTKKSVGE